jgi:hypothetical protein
MGTRSIHNFNRRKFQNTFVAKIGGNTGKRIQLIVTLTKETEIIYKQEEADDGNGEREKLH